jgi:hypothetical protein
MKFDPILEGITSSGEGGSDGVTAVERLVDSFESAPPEVIQQADKYRYNSEEVEGFHLMLLLSVQ